MLKTFILGLLIFVSVILILLGLKRTMLFVACDVVDALVVGEDRQVKDGHKCRYPIYEFVWNGEKMTAQDPSPRGDKIGTSMKIRIKRDGSVLPKNNGFFFLALGLVWGACALAMF